MWRLTETELWDSDALDTVHPAFIRFDGDRLGSMCLIVIQADLDCRYGQRDGRPLVEFTFEGDDDGHPCSGRGWAAIEDDGKLRGRIFIHSGDDSEFMAEHQDEPRVGSKPRTSRTR